MSGIFYGVGVGPGDSELLTVKAVKVIEQADIIIVPKSGSTQDSTAFNIAKPYIKPETEFLPMVFPMAGKQKDWTDAWVENREIIGKELDKGKKVVFLTLGDPMFYSTYIYVFNLLKEANYEIYTVPGITAFCGIASHVGFPLVEGDDVLSVLPATTDEETIEQTMKYSNNLVIMKVSKNTNALVEKLKENGFKNAVLVSRCGLPDEEVIHNLDDVTDAKVNYLSTILARRN